MVKRKEGEEMIETDRDKERKKERERDIDTSVKMEGERVIK